MSEENSRLWVREHAGIKQWHWFKDGHYHNAVCGYSPIAGSPLVSATMPANVCLACQRIAKLEAAIQPFIDEAREVADNSWNPDSYLYLTITVAELEAAEEAIRLQKPKIGE